MAIRKPLGGVRGLVVGDFLRRLVAGTLAQQFGPAPDAATQPHQYALSTRAKAESWFTASTLPDPSLTVLSVDGIGAYDFVSRQAMLRGLCNVPAPSRLCGPSGTAGRVPARGVCAGFLG